MRIDEITINIPIKIELDGDKPKVNVAGQDAEGDELSKNPVMLSPQQQELEMKKADLGKESPALDKVTGDSEVGDEEEPEQKQDIVSKLKSLAGIK